MNIQEQAEVIWDKYSQHIEDDSFSFSQVAGTSMMSREQFMDAVNELAFTTIPSTDMVEKMAGVFYSNKSDESDEGSSIVSDDYYKMAALCAEIAQKHIEEEVLRAIEWLKENFYLDGHGFWLADDDGKRDYESATELYTLYQQSLTK